MAYGRRNHIKTNPLSYNIMILGEPKIGKTTTMKEICEKIVGEDGYLFVEFRKERGADAIENIMYVNSLVWNVDSTGLFGEALENERKRMEEENEVFFDELVDDIVNNKETEYSNLKVMIWDTLDQIIPMAQEESIRLWNSECRKAGHPEKQASSINGAWGGYGHGDTKAMDIMDEIMTRLERVGVKVIILGHVKNKDVTDVMTGETYQTITSDQQQNYFNHFKKNLHFLGLAYLDRKIAKEKTNKKDNKGNAVMVGKVKDEVRRIKFRDDNHAVDSGSRFKDIATECEFTADAIIKTFEDAIRAEKSKAKVYDNATNTPAKSQENYNSTNNTVQENNEKVSEEDTSSNSVTLDEAKKQILNFFARNKNNKETIIPVLSKIKNLGYSNPTMIDKLEDAEAILAII